MLVLTRRSLWARSPPNWVVHSGAERGPAPVRPLRDLAVPAEGAEGLGELDPEVDRESVALLRSLQGDDRDVFSRSSESRPAIWASSPKRKELP